MKEQNDFLLDTEDEEKEKDGQSPEDIDGDEEIPEDKEIFRGPYGPLTKEEIEKRGFEIRTIKFTPFDLLIALVSLMLFTVSGCGMGVLSVLALVVSAPLYAVFSYRIGNNFSFFIPLAALVASGFITKDPLMPLGTLLATAMSYIMLYCVNNRRDASKTSAVVGCCFAISIYLVAAFIVSDIMGKISARELLSIIDEVFGGMEAYAYEMYSEMANIGFDLGLTDVELKNAAKQFALSSRSLLPSVAIISFMLISYASASLLPLTAKICGAKKMLSDTKYEIKLSKISVAVYLVSWLMAFIGTGVFGYTFRNITAILAPALSLCGIKQIGDFFVSKGMPKVAAFLIQTVSIVAALTLGDIGLSVLMMFGVFHTLKEPATRGNA